MGYAENFLPQAMARLGHEIHIITSTAQVYFDQPFYYNTYFEFLGDPIKEKGVYIEKGVCIHRLPFNKILKKHLFIPDLISKIKELKPDIIHTFDHTGLDTLRIAILQIISPNFKLFTANHNGYHALFPSGKNTVLKQKIKNKISKLYLFPIGRFISWRIVKCYAVTTDAMKIAEEWYGVHKNKIQLTPLGVDISLFYPNEIRKQNKRNDLNIKPESIVCIHTGKLTEQKNPILLAKAIKILNENYNLPFLGLFIGEGDQKKMLEASPYCICLDYQKHDELPDFYRAADIAVWHLSVTNSFFDAVASGLPLVCGDDVNTYAKIESEDKSSIPKIVSRFCKINDCNDLAVQLRSLVINQENLSLIKDLGKKGVDEIKRKYSWEAIAKERQIDYQKALN
ncbi:MAG: glycosyltransferase family 4 protein [Saprospiraceae bacterium]